MRRVLRTGALLAATCVSPLTAADAPVLLDVVVERSGNPEPLVAADFTVTDADGALAVESVELRSVADSSGAAPPQASIESADEEREAARRASRLFAIFIDEFHLAESAQLSSIRAALAQFVRSGVGPHDLLVVMKPLEPLTTIRLTADREAAARAIESALGRAGDYAARTPFERQFVAGSPERIDDARARISLAALGALVAHVGHLPGARKTLLVVSEGFAPPAATPRGPVPGFDDIGRSATVGRVAMYLVHTRARGTAEAGGPATTDAGRAGAFARNPLAALAAATTGFTAAAGPGLAADLARILRDASRFYVLKVQPGLDRSGDAFRAVTVRVDRQDAVVRARAGFRLAPPAPPERQAYRAPPPLDVARRTSHTIRPWFGLSSADGDRMRVRFIWEPTPRVPGSGDRDVRPETVSLRVTTMSGEPVFSGRVRAAGAASAAPGTVPRLSFDADPGRLLAQMEILDAAGRVVDRDVRDLVVSPFPSPLALGTPEVVRVRTARELRPLIEGEDAVPTVARDFSRADHLVIRVPVIGGDEAEVRAALVSAFGGAMRDLPVRRLPSHPRVAQLDLALAGLASGGYVIHVDASSPGARASERIAFSVRP